MAKRRRKQPTFAGIEVPKTTLGKVLAASAVGGIVWAIIQAFGGSSDGGQMLAPVDGTISTALIFGDSQMEPLGPLLVKGLAAAGVTTQSWAFNRGWSVNDYLTKSQFISTSNLGGQPNPLATSAGVSADLVIIQIGTNDAKAGISQAALGANIQTLSERIKAKRVVLVGPAVVQDPSFAANAADVSSWMPSIASYLGWDFIDSSQFVTSGWYDGIHFNTSVYSSTWAPGILSRLLPSIGLGDLGAIVRSKRS